MVKEVTLDSSVLVSSLVGKDVFNLTARRVMEKVFSGEYHTSSSAIVPVEVCASISRRAGLDKAFLAKSQLLRWEKMGLVAYSEFTHKRREEAIELAIRLRMRGMDAIVVQVAKEKGAVLITFDKEMAEKARAEVEVLTHDELQPHI